VYSVKSLIYYVRASPRLWRAEDVRADGHTSLKNCRDRQYCASGNFDPNQVFPKEDSVSRKISPELKASLKFKASPQLRVSHQPKVTPLPKSKPPTALDTFYSSKIPIRPLRGLEAPIKRFVKTTKLRIVKIERVKNDIP